MKIKEIQRFFLDVKVKDLNILNLWVLAYVAGKRVNVYEDSIAIKPGFFLSWAKNCDRQLNLKDLKGFLYQSINENRIPPEMENIYTSLHKRRKSSLLTAMRYSVELYEKFPKIQSVLPLPDLLRLWSSFVQVFNKRMGDEVKKHVDTKYQAIVEERLPVAEKQLKEFMDDSLKPPEFEPPPELPILERLKIYLENRPDEKGEVFNFEQNPFEIRHASFIGPVHAQKSENQDATYVKLIDPGFIFALADGVGTSMGARVASALAVREFCERAANEIERNSCFRKESLSSALEHVHRRLNELLEVFLEKVAEPDFASVRGIIQPDVAGRLCQNTINPKRRHWGPVLSTTLIGGAVLKSGHKYIACLVRIGDGAVERSRAGESGDGISSYFDMNEEEMAIESSLCPGPLGELSVKKAEITDMIELKEGDTLLISSDGLVRGHHLKVLEILKEFNTDFKNAQPFDLLKDISNRADRLYNDSSHQQKLFSDNISMILVTIKETT